MVNPDIKILSNYLNRATQNLLAAKTPAERFKWRLIKNTISIMLADLQAPAPELVFIEKVDNSEKR